MTAYHIIKKASCAVLSICGEQDYIVGHKYRISNYVIVVNVEDGQLYHSCLTGELLLVKDHIHTYEYLIKHWFLVEKDIDEKVLIPRIKKLMRSLKAMQKTGYKTVEIITTTLCNAQCYYCYEKLFRPMSMTEKTAIKVADFIERHCESNNIFIKWYGGEPLMNVPVIDKITSELTEHGIEVNSSMISNGYLLTEEIIKRAANNWHLRNVRITIDGTEAVYNQIKNYKHCTENAFNRVLKNIDCLIQSNISVTIRLNIEKKNIEDIQSLIFYLCNKYRNCHLLDFMLRPLNNTDSNKCIESIGKERNDILNKITQLKFELFNNGFYVNCGKLSGMTLCTCIADSGKYVVIKPNGELAYCSADFDKKAYGSIFCDSQNIAYPKLSDNLFEKEKICDTCPLYPICSPSKLCPSCYKPICNATQKEYNISDIKLTMLKEYRLYKQLK